MCNEIWKLVTTRAGSRKRKHSPLSGGEMQGGVEAGKRRERLMFTAARLRTRGVLYQAVLAVGYSPGYVT